MEVFGISIPVTPLLLTALLCLLAYTVLTWNFGYWKERGIPGPKPYPLLGTIYEMFDKGALHMDKSNAKKYGNVYGEFFGMRPTLTVGDPEMIKRIMVKDFSHFTARGFANEFSNEKYTGKMITSLKGEEWKRVRNTITPAFSGSKMKAMISQVNKCVNTFIENLKNNKTEERPIKDFTDNFTFDVIARVGFGVELDSQKDPNNPFIRNGRKVFNFRPTWKNPAQFIGFFIPPLFRLLKKIFPDSVYILDKGASLFFVDLIEKIKKERENGAKGNIDLIQMMINSHQLQEKPEEIDTGIGGLRESSDDTPQRGLSDEEIIGQSFILFIAGFETTSNTLGFVMYELALNPDCQKKAQEEIDKIIEGKDEVSYEMSHEFHYLEMCISETLRKYPIASRTDRNCNKEITIKGITIPKGMNVSISIAARHFDPEIYPDPEKYDPERFSPEAKAARDPINYIPFSVGPRNCIGMRLAQMELRISLAKILHSFSIKPCEKTEVPLTLANMGLLQPKDGIFLTFEPRHHL